jgi:hypothetical protein
MIVKSRLSPEAARDLERYVAAIRNPIKMPVLRHISAEEYLARCERGMRAYLLKRDLIHGNH